MCEKDLVLTEGEQYAISDRSDREMMNPFSSFSYWSANESVIDNISMIMLGFLLGPLALLTYPIWRPFQLLSRRRCAARGHVWHWYWPSRAFGPDDDRTPRHYCKRCGVSGELLGHTGREAV